MKLKGVSPLDPQGKDALAILSTNAMAVAQVMKARKDAKTLADFSRVVCTKLGRVKWKYCTCITTGSFSPSFTGLEKEASRIRDALGRLIFMEEE